MGSAEFRRHAMKITGCGRGWQKPLALKLGLSLVTIKRYSSGYRAIPRPIELLIKELLK